MALEHCLLFLLIVVASVIMRINVRLVGKKMSSVSSWWASVCVVCLAAVGLVVVVVTIGVVGP